MTVKELRKALDKLPLDYDDFKVVTYQPTVEAVFDGENESLKFSKFDDIELKRLNILKLDCKIRIN